MKRPIGDLPIGAEFELSDGRRGTIWERGKKTVLAIVDGPLIGEEMTLLHKREVEPLGTMSPYAAKPGRKL